MKENSKLRYFGIGFLVILICLLAFKISREGIYSKKTGINIAVAGKDGIAILILRPEEDFLGWVKLPDNLKVKIYNTGAQYPAGSLWDYGVLEKHPYDIVEKSLGGSVGVAIARTMRINGNVSMAEVLGNLHKLSLRTDISIRDRFLMRQFIADSVASKKVLELEIPKNALDTVTEPDGKEFVVFNNVAALWTKNKFVLESILNESAEVSVNNLSGIAGLGISLSKQMEAAGVRVIDVKSDAADDIGGSGCSFVINGDYPYTVAFLEEQLGCVLHKSNQGSEEKGIKAYLK